MSTLSRQPGSQPRAPTPALQAARSAALLAALALLPAAAPAAQEDAARGGPSQTDRFRAMLKERAEVQDEGPAGVGQLVPDLAFTDVEGRPGRLSDYADQRALVLAVRQIGCPVGERYAPRLARLEREFADRAVAFLYLNMDTFLDPEEVREHERGQHGFQGRYVHDPEEVFGRALGTESTTVCYLLDSARTLRYRGAVDEQHGRGVVGEDAGQEYLRDALEAVLAGERVRLAATTAPGCLLGIEREPPTRPAGEPPTYHREVARVLQQNCVECHHEGGPGPFALDDYESAYNRRRMIAMVVREGIMPPWYAADGTGPWKNDRRLTERERSAVLDWVAADGPAGDPAETPVPLHFESGWVIGTPDETFTFPRPFEIPAEGEIEWTHVVSETVVPRDLWVARIQLLPSDKRVVHHASAEFQTPLPPERPPAARRVLQTLTPWTRRPIPKDRTWQYLFGYLPGKDPRTYGDGVARFLPKGSRVRFGMHYTPIGEATEDATTLGLVLADGPTPFLAETLYMHSKEVDIPPGETAEFTAEMRVPYDVLLRSLTPHMHLRGSRFNARAIYPDGTDELLIEIPQWDQDWQNSYELAEPRTLPRGTRLQITGSYDNTASNPSNPDPTQHVRLGQQITDEMLTMAVEWIRPREEALERPQRSNPQAPK